MQSEKFIFRQDIVVEFGENIMDEMGLCMRQMEKLVERFIEASIKYGVAVEMGDFKETNKQSRIS